MGTAFRPTEPRRPVVYVLAAAVVAAVIALVAFATLGSDEDETVIADSTTTTVAVDESTETVLTRAVQDMLRGPTADERAAGAESWFSDETAGMLRGVEFDEASGVAVVDFADLRPVIPNASASAGSQMLLAELDGVVFAFDEVRAVEYRIDGSCTDFFEWLQMGCETRTR